MALAAVLLVAGTAARAGTARKMTIRVGEQLEFAAAPGVTDGVLWRLDDQVVSEAARWIFAPAASDVGVHRVTITVGAPDRARRRTWHVRVRLPRPLHVVAAEPAAELLEVPGDAEIELRFEVASREEAEQVVVAWSVDGAAAGEGPLFRVRRPGPVTVRVRALASGTLGSAVAHEWRLTFEARVVPPVTGQPTPESTVPGLVTSTSLMPSTRAPLPSTSTTAPVPVPISPVTSTSTTAPARPVPSVSGPPSHDEVGALLGELAAAWRQRDVAALRRLGQVNSDEQATALAGYFTTVRDLDVQIELQEVSLRGERTFVRFVRRDTFRSPGGEIVTKLSPPLDKEVVRDAGGHLRLGSGAR